MSRSTFMVRPKAAQTLPRMEEWVVTRTCPVTKTEETFEVTCVEGEFFNVYRKLGLASAGGVEFDPVVDRENGRLSRTRIRTFR